MKTKNRKESRVYRHLRIRKRIAGTAERPRMAIMVSRKHMYVQFIDDERGCTLASASTMDATTKHNVAGARLLGGMAAAAAMERGIKAVVVDRGGFLYHGRVRAIVEGAVAGGLVTGAVLDEVELRETRPGREEGRKKPTASGEQKEIES